MREDQFNHLLASIPGAKRAAEGIIIPMDNGAFFHIRDIHDIKEMEGLSQEEGLFYAFCSKNEILRLRELRGAYDYLLRLRAYSIVDSARAVRVMAARRREFEKNGRPWSLTHYYHSKDQYHKSYIRHLARPHAKTLKRVPSGLAFIPEANAICIRSLAGDVVVASESLERFYYFMSIAFYGNQLGIELIDRIDASLIALRIMIGSEAQDFELDSRGDLPVETERVLSELVLHQMQFTFGHEYAHLLCGHHSLQETVVNQSTNEEKGVYLKELCVYEHELEFQADLCALTQIPYNSKAFTEVAHGAFSVLLYLDFLTKAWEIFGLHKSSVSETHPAPIHRIQRLHKDLGRRSPLNEKDLTGMFDVSGELIKTLKHRQIGQREDILTFYGSLYLPSYVTKPRRDRYDY